MNHYETLGVAADASQEEITRAYRRKAATTHPDKGGSVEEFQRVEAAGACLRDPERRAQYDSSGYDGRGPEVKTKEQRIYALIVQSWMTIADPLARPSKQISAIMADLRKGIEQMGKEEPKLRERLAKLETRFGLIESGGELNAYEDALLGHIANIETQLSQISDMKDAMVVMEGMLKQYKLTAYGEKIDREQAETEAAQSWQAEFEQALIDSFLRGRK